VKRNKTNPAPLLEIAAYIDIPTTLDVAIPKY